MQTKAVAFNLVETMAGEISVPEFNLPELDAPEFNLRETNAHAFNFGQIDCSGALQSKAIKGTRIEAVFVFRILNSGVCIRNLVD